MLKVMECDKGFQKPDWDEEIITALEAWDIYYAKAHYCKRYFNLLGS